MKNSINKNQKYLAAIIIAISTFFFFFPSINNQFVIWDDNIMIRDNQTITSFSGENISKWITSSYYGLYHPLVQFSYAIEYKFFGPDPFIYHLDNLILHVCNAILVFLFILLLLDDLPIAFLTGLLWGIHPVHVESVAWASERKDVLYAFFFLTSLILYLHYLNTTRKKTYTFSITFFFLSLLSKPMAISLPLILLLIDYLRGRKLDIKLLIEKFPFFLLSFIFGIISILAKQATGGLAVPEPSFSIINLFVASYRLLFYYLPRIILPVNFNRLYPLNSYLVDSLTPLPLEFIISPLLLIIVFSLFLWVGNKKKYILFGGLFFLSAIFPIIPIMVPGAFADRYSYLPSLGIYFLVVWAGTVFYRKNDKYKKILSGTTIIFLIFLGVFSWKNTHIWYDDLSLQNEICKWYPKVPAAFHLRGLILNSRREFDKAMADFNYSLQLDPKFIPSYNSRGNAYSARGFTDKAFDDFTLAVKFGEKDAASHNNLGYILLEKGDYNKASEQFEIALKLNPNMAEIYHNRGNLQLINKNFPEAISEYNQALQINPRLAITYFKRSVAYFNLADYRKAYADLEKAQSLGFQVNRKDKEILLEKLK